MDAQADLSLRWAHSHIVGFVISRLIFNEETFHYQNNFRSSLEQAGWAIEKLKLDLTEANTRNSMLAKEVDERHASMEKSSESKLL